MSFPSPAAAPLARQGLRRLHALTPVALFAAPGAAIGALVAASHSNSIALISLAALALIASIAGFGAWLVITDRKARMPMRLPLSDADWRRFERSFWTHVRRCAELPPAQPGPGEA
jgi:hypothetical protein